MSRNLKSIWAGFESKTSRPLTGGGVENINAPTRTDEDDFEKLALPEDYVAPAEAAFTALRRELTRTAQEAARRGGRSSRRREDGPGFDANDMAVESSLSSGAVADLVQALAATERRVQRTDQDYRAFMAANAGRKLKESGRKKFLGLF